MADVNRSLVDLNLFQSIVPARSPGHLGRHDAADPNQSLCRAGETPGVLGKGNDFAEVGTPARAPITLKALVFETLDLARFFQSVGLAMAVERYTKVEWKEYEDDKVLSILYSVMWWKGKPGVAVLKTGEKVEVEQYATEKAQEFARVFVRKSTEGPKQAARYLASLEAVRASALQTARKAMDDVKEINQGVIKETQEYIRSLASYKYWSDITINTAGLFTGASLAAIAINIGYSAVTEVIKSANEAPHATVIAVVGSSSEGDKAKGKDAGNPDSPVLKGLEKANTEAAKEAVKAGLEKTSEEAVKKSEHLGKVENVLEKELAAAEQALKRKISSRKRAKWGRKTDALKAEQLAAAKGASRFAKVAKVAKNGAKVLNIVFFLQNVYEAEEEFQKTWASAE